MASGSQNLTTYIAKRIIGDSTNVNWAGALLHNGTGGKTSVMDTWIFADDYGSASSTYGILHRQSDDKIMFIGASVDRFWNNLNTGDTYINGKLGINYNPETSGNSYQLYVNGTSNFSDDIFFHKDGSLQIFTQTNGKNYSGGDTENVCIQTSFDDYDYTYQHFSTYLNRVNLLLQPKGGQVYIGWDLTSLGNTNNKLYVNGNTYFNGNATITGNAYIGKYTANTAQPQDYWIQLQGGSGGIFMFSQAAATGAVGIGRWTAANAWSYQMYWDQSNNLFINAGNLNINGNIMPQTTTTYLLGDASHEWGSLDTRQLYVRHIDSSRNFTDDLNIYYGYQRGLHHLFYSCNDGASRVHCTTIDVDGIWCKSGWFRSYGDTGWYNESYGGGWWMQDSTWIRAYNGKSVYVEATLRSDGTIQAGATGGTTLTQGRLSVNTGANPEGNNTLGHGVSLYHDNEGGNITIYSGNVASYGSYYWQIDAYNGNLRAYNVNSSGTYKGEISIQKDNVVLFGAAWNDYAEMRNIPEANDYGQEGQQSKMAGRCVQEVGDDTMIMTNDRLQLGCKIVSDTFGFNIGETEECKTPIAVSGRVLAYLYEGREAAKSHIGRPVCSGPNGTVSIMTEDEEKAYPSRIVGIISAVPDYKYWGTGNVEVNDRIWIYVH